MLDAALAELVAIDPDALTDDELHALVVAEQQLQSQLAAISARHLSAWERRAVWALDGSKAAWARLARDCSLSSAGAKHLVARAKKLHLMPVVADAFEGGKLSEDQVDLLCTARQPAIECVFDRDETLLVNEIVNLEHRDATAFVDYWIERAYEEVGRDRSRPDPMRRQVDLARTIDGHFDLKGWLDPLAGSEIEAELRSIEQELFESDWAAAREAHGDGATAADLPRTRRMRMHDALAQMARNSRACRQGKFRQPRPLITVVAGLGTFGRMCELADGTVVGPDQVFPLLSTADIERIVFDGPSRVIDVGVRERLFTGALRRAIEVRDRTCQFPGCDVPAEECQIDHKIKYADGGLTTQENGRCACPKHNRDRERKRPPPVDW